MARRKILFCDNSLRELLNFRKEIICHYASNGYDVVLVAPQNMDIYQWELPNIRFVPVIMNRSGTNPIEDLKYFFRLKRIYAKEKPDYIFHYTIKPNIYGTFAAQKLWHSFFCYDCRTGIRIQQKKYPELDRQIFI